MDNSLIIVDEYVTQVGNNCKIEGADILDGTILTEYINILKSISEHGIYSGEINSALVSYIGCAEQIQSKLATISESMKTICDNFTEEVDEIDQYTF